MASKNKRAKGKRQIQNRTCFTVKDDRIKKAQRKKVRNLHEFTKTPISRCFLIADNLIFRDALCYDLQEEKRRKTEERQRKKEAAAAEKAENKLRNKQASDAEKMTTKRERSDEGSGRAKKRKKPQVMTQRFGVLYQNMSLLFDDVFTNNTEYISSLTYLFCRADAHLTRKTSNHSASRDKYQLIQHSSFKQNIAGSVSCALFVVPMFFSTDVFCNLHCTL